MNHSKFVLIMSVLVALVMILSAFAVFGGIQPSSNDATGRISPQTSSVPSHLPVTPAIHKANGLSSRAVDVLNALESRGIPTRDIYIPNFNNRVNRLGGNLIGPSYTSAPAPMGIGAYGLKLVNGSLVNSNLTTSSFSATVNMSNLNDLYAYDDAPTSISMQLNAVLDNVAIFGNSSYAFWTQNVIFFSPRTNTLELLDNLWNFSSPAFNFNVTSLYSYQGVPVPPEYYYDVGPSFHVTFPFIVSLYLNTTLVDGRSTVFYNYSLTTDGHYYSGSYDEIQFNSTPTSNPSYVAPQPTYLVSGNTVTPDGFIPYDAEIMLGGPGGGSTANVNEINATMQLKYYNSTAGRYLSVPSTFDVGSETGETSQGVSVSWNASDHVAQLSAGPSYVYPMWGLNNNAKMYSYSGIVSPSNAFLFATPGSAFNTSIAQLVPQSVSGTYSFRSPISGFSAKALLSDYLPSGYEMMPGHYQQISLAQDFNTGIYTPLYAMNNQQLANISMYGAGTEYDPYVLFNNPSSTGYLNPLFGEVNDYFFPSYYGVLIADSSAHVVVQNMPEMNVQYVGASLNSATFFGLPHTNTLDMVVYSSSNVQIDDNFIFGWFSYEQTEFPVANVLLWNSQNVTVSWNTFFTMDSSLLIYDTSSISGNNMVYGNIFYQDPNLNATGYKVIDVSTDFSSQYMNPVGLTLYSNNNTIFFNAFDVYSAAISPNYSIYSGFSVNYTDSWDLGNFGNFWWNYHFNFRHNEPYNNDGLITSGYDYFPMPLIGAHPANLLRR